MLANMRYGSLRAIDRVKLGGRWYFLDARFGDKMQDGYLHFCFNYEQATEMGYTINSSLKYVTAIDCYAPYISGALDGAIESVEHKIQSGLNAGKKAITVVPNRIAFGRQSRHRYGGIVR